MNLKITPSNFNVSPELIDITLKNISDFSPDAILLPSFIDNHEEHWILNQILAKALAKHKTEVEIIMFEVWTAFSPNLVFNITNVMDNKLAAISCYKSQLESINYIDSITGLNRYRSITHFKGEGYCEGFISLKSSDYVQFVNK